MIFPGEVFAETKEFDSNIRQLLPYYDEMLDAIALCVPPETNRILELGCGTGELTRKVLLIPSPAGQERESPFCNFNHHF